MFSERSTLALFSWQPTLCPLLLPPDAPAQLEAAVEAARLRDRLLALRAAQELAPWLEAQPQLGQDVFARGQPEWVGTGLATAHQVDVVSFPWASMALFDDGARDVDTGVIYRPPCHDICSARWKRGSASRPCSHLCRTARPWTDSCRPQRPNDTSLPMPLRADVRPGRARCSPAWNWRGKGMSPWSRRALSRRSICKGWGNLQHPLVV